MESNDYIIIIIAVLSSFMKHMCQCSNYIGEWGRMKING